jgi:predicted nicotinamide N-methyase
MTAVTSPLAALIRWPLERVRAPLVPELELWLLAASVDVSSACAELADLDPPPFWAMCWAGGQVLARYVLDHPEEVRGKRVIDFGAGCGIAGLAAARAGARSVTALDLDLASLRAVEANATLNGLSVVCAREFPTAWDVLLAADVFYEPAARDVVLAHACQSGRVLVSDAERAPDHRVPGEVLMRVEARTVPDVDLPVKHASVFALRSLEAR